MIALLAVVGGLMVLPLTIFFALSGAPLVAPPAPLTFDDAARVKQILHENNPMRGKPGEIKNLSVSDRECNLIIDYALARVPGGSRMAGALAFSSGGVIVKGSLRLPHNPIGNYINAEVEFEPAENIEDIVRVTKFQIGWIRIPSFLINGGRWVVTIFAKQDPQLRAILELTRGVKELRFEPDRAQLGYQLGSGIMKRIRRHGQQLLFSKSDRETILLYHRVLKQLVNTAAGEAVSLSRLLPTLFILAKLRSERGADPVQENRFLIITLTTFCLGKRIYRVIGLPPVPGDTPRMLVTLRGRVDLAKHYMVSAALAASAGSGLANFAGVFKEVSDAKGGSGFSFADLLADRAGVRLGELAIYSPETAVQLQQQMVTALMEPHFMPDIDDMPEGLQEKAFKHRYTDLDSATYRQVEAEINRRISACPVFASFK